MPTVCGYVKFPCGTKYHSKRIFLDVFDYERHGLWTFSLPVDSEPKGRPQRDGKLTLHLRDGRVGEGVCAGSNEEVLRFEGVGMLEKPVRKVATSP